MSREPDVLRWAATLVDPALRAAVEPIAEPVRRVVAYHFGWADREGRPTSATGGKSLRAGLAVLSGRVTGQPDCRTGVPAAVAVQFVHEFSLLHDDVMDADETRRHRPTAWTVYGPGLAILAGDALLARAAAELLAVEPYGVAATRSLADATGELIAGQAADLLQERRDDVSLDECLTMVRQKTGALMSCAASLGAVLAGAPAEVVDGLAEFGASLGFAFQLVDDVLGIWGDPAVTGKPVHADLRRHKRSVPVVAALRAREPAAGRLARLLAETEMADEDDVVLAVKLIEECGARDWTQAAARREAETAVDRLERLALPHDVRTAFREIAAFVVGRQL